jgi:hypothetical protein
MMPCNPKSAGKGDWDAERSFEDGGRVTKDPAIGLDGRLCYQNKKP